jgi:HAD superfamily hydrolase (TIGR01490 family)
MNLTLFDLDNTLLPIDSDHAFGEFMIAIGWADAQGFRQRNGEFYAQYQAEALDVAAYVAFATSPWRSRSADEQARASRRFMAEVVQAHIQPCALELVQRHQQAGDATALVTATNAFVTAPIAQAFGLRDLIATELARDALGAVTGAIEGVPCFREGKITRVVQWLSARGHQRSDFDRITVYSDSSNDLPLLEWATHPVATNPGAALARTARERGWPILNLFE